MNRSSWQMGLTVACLLTTCWIADRLARLAGLLPPASLAIPAVLILVRPITSEFLLGQTNLLWGGLMAGFVFFDVTRRPWRAALCLALAVSLKAPAALFLVFFALSRRWGILGQTLAALLVINGFAAALLDPAQPFSLFHAWGATLLSSGVDRAFEIGNQSLLALCGRLLRRDGFGLNVLALSEGAVAAVAGSLLLLLFLSVCVPRRHPSPSAQRTIMDDALLNVLIVLASPTCWVATYSALLFPVVVALALLSKRPQVTWTHAGLAASAAAAGLLSLMTHAKFWRAIGIPRIKGESYVYLVLMILPLFGLALFTYLWLLRREPPGSGV